MSQLLEKFAAFSPPKRGSLVSGEVIQVLPDKVLVDFGGKSEGEITGREFAELKKAGMLPEVGEKITALVVIPEDEAGTTILSVKTTTTQSVWDKLEKAAKEKAEVEAKIKDLAKGGILLEIKGLRGFIPAIYTNSQILKNIEKLKDEVVKVQPVEVDRDKNRLICRLLAKISRKEQAEIAKKFKKGEKYSGVVATVLPFGLVVDFDNLSTFVPNSELLWEKVDEPANLFKAGQEIDFVFCGLDESATRIEISPKLTTPDPLTEIAKKQQDGTPVKGKISKVTDFGLFVSLEDGIEGLIHISKIPPDAKFGEGEQVTCNVESVDKTLRKVSLSLVLKAKPVGYR